MAINEPISYLSSLIGYIIHNFFTQNPRNPQNLSQASPRRLAWCESKVRAFRMGRRATGAFCGFCVFCVR